MVVRVLVTSSAMAGHFAPLAPFVDAFLAARVDVEIVIPESAYALASQLGVPVRVGGSPHPAESERLWRQFRHASRAQASVIANREIFGRLNTDAMLPTVRTAITEYRPDLLLHEPTEYAGPIVAIQNGVPHAQVAISLAQVEAGSLRLAEPVLDEHGPVTTALLDEPYLTRFPAALDPSPYRRTHRYREPAQAPRPLPDWWPAQTGPLVYVTFGTVTGALGAGIYRAAVDALAELPVRALITTGRDLDLGTLPSHVHAEAWVPQSDVLAAASAMVCHGGSGTALAGLAAAVPMVVVPMFADQIPNARILADLGVAIVVKPVANESAVSSTSYRAEMVTALRAGIEDILATNARERAHIAAHDLASLPIPAELTHELGWLRPS